MKRRLDNRLAHLRQTQSGKDEDYEAAIWAIHRVMYNFERIKLSSHWNDIKLIYTADEIARFFPLVSYFYAMGREDERYG